MRKPKHIWNPSIRPHGRGFEHTGGLVSKALGAVSGTRGFAQARLLTQWAQICGDDIAEIAQPLRVSYSRGGMGATLIVTCTSARAPEVQMQADLIRQRVNTCYGYNAISRVRVTQTDQDGFAERKSTYTYKPTPDVEPVVASPKAARQVEGIEDAGLRQALGTLAENVLTRTGGQTTKRSLK